MKKYGITIDWTNANVMPYLQDLAGRFAKYNIATGILFVIWAIICIVIVVLCFISCIKKREKYRGFDFFDEGKIETTCMIIFGAMGIVCLFSGIDMLVKNIFVPELYLFEYVQTFLKITG